VSGIVKQGEAFEVSVMVKNISDIAGSEVVQLYLRDVESTLERPEKELKGFAKVALEPGQEERVTFELDMRALSYYDPHQGGWVAEPGRFEALVGASSRDIRLRASFELIVNR
jgi:beta-glucosidase